MQTEIDNVFNRKKELIQRDPLFHELSKTFKKGIEIGIHRRQDGSMFEDADIMTPLRPMREGFDYSKTKRNQNQNLLFLELIELGNDIQDKWRVFIKFSFSTKQIFIEAPLVEEKIFIGKPFLQDKKGISYFRDSVNRSNKHLYHWLPYPNSFNENPRLSNFDDFMMMCKKSSEGQNYLPVIINTSRLNKLDAKTIKKQLWSIIEINLQEKAVKKPWKESKECSFLYSIRDEQTFEKYLRCYDLHMGNDYTKPNGLSFRAIAFGEYVLKNHPEKYENAMNKIASRRKAISSRKGEKVIEGYVGESVKGEDAIEKGVKLIYKAIHRKPYPSVKTKQKEYYCPIHATKCPMECPHLKKFMKDFNKRHMQFLPLKTVSPEQLSQLSDNTPKEDSTD